MRIEREYDTEIPEPCHICGRIDNNQGEPLYPAHCPICDQPACLSCSNDDGVCESCQAKQELVSKILKAPDCCTSKRDMLLPKSKHKRAGSTPLFDNKKLFD